MGVYGVDPKPGIPGQRRTFGYGHVMLGCDHSTLSKNIKSIYMALNTCLVAGLAGVPRM